VFDDPDKLDRLEALIHPRVRTEWDRLRSEYQRDPAVKAIVEDVALLLESGSADGCDVLVFVDADRSQRLARVRRSRGWSDADLAAREKNQWPLDRKRVRADYVIQNDRGEAECFTQVRQVLSRVIHEQA
jgi:dephospho-CoA kinase